VRGGLQLVEQRGQRVALGHGLAERGDRGVVLVVTALGLASCRRLLLGVGELLVGRVDLGLQVRGLLALGRKADEPHAPEGGGDEHDHDDQAVARGHGVFPGVVDGAAKKSVIENCG
jgi:hypothetical protein